MKQKVCVIIPFYQYQLNNVEKVAFDNIYTTLAEYNITLIKPHSLDFTHLKSSYPSLSIESFDESYFHGRTGFNRLMLSNEFYDRFSNFEYILITKLDCYIFNDELLDFCNKGYDYISALHVEKKSWFSKLFSNNNSSENILGCERITLRKVSTHISALKQHSEKRDYYLVNEIRENKFWTTEIPDFTYPNDQEALSFAFDEHPEDCFALNKNKLPFACCKWHERGMVVKFWAKYIKV